MAEQTKSNLKTSAYKRALAKGFIQRPAEHTLMRHNLLEWWKEHQAAQSTQSVQTVQTEAPPEPVKPVEEPKKKRRRVLHGSPV
jgi:hypothetical protein